MNEDGQPDYAVVQRTDHAPRVYLGRGDGTCAPRVRDPVAQSPIGLALGGVHGPGHLDLVSASAVTPTMPPGSSKVVVHPGQGDGTFLSRFDT